MIKCILNHFSFSVWQHSNFDCFTDFFKKQNYFDSFHIFVIWTILQVLFFDYSSLSPNKKVLKGHASFSISTLRWLRKQSFALYGAIQIICDTF